MHIEKLMIELLEKLNSTEIHTRGLGTSNGQHYDFRLTNPKIPNSTEMNFKIRLVYLNDYGRPQFGSSYTSIEKLLNMFLNNEFIFRNSEDVDEIIKILQKIKKLKELFTLAE